MSKIGGHDSCYNDVCYWRKFWQFRERTLTYLGDKYNEDFDGTTAILDIEDLNWFSDQLMGWIKDHTKFQSDCDGYWDWCSDMRDQIFCQLNNLEIVKEKLESDKNNEYKCYWYDSY